MGKKDMGSSHLGTLPPRYQRGLCSPAGLQQLHCRQGPELQAGRGTAWCCDPDGHRIPSTASCPCRAEPWLLGRGSLHGLEGEALQLHRAEGWQQNGVTWQTGVNSCLVWHAATQNSVPMPRNKLRATHLFLLSALLSYLYTYIHIYLLVSVYLVQITQLSVLGQTLLWRLI